MIIDPLFALLISVCCALLFGGAGLHKLRHHALAQQSIADYQLVPPALVPITGWLVSLLEIAIASGLLFATTRVIAATLGAALLCLYAIAMAINLYRGRRDLDCGCSFGGTRQSISELLVLRNVLLAVLLLASSLPASDRGLGALDVFTLGAGVLVASLLYATLNTLIENQTKRI